MTTKPHAVPSGPDRSFCATRVCPNYALDQFGLTVCSICVTPDALVHIANEWQRRLGRLEDRVSELTFILTGKGPA